MSDTDIVLLNTRIRSLESKVKYLLSKGDKTTPTTTTPTKYVDFFCDMFDRADSTYLGPYWDSESVVSGSIRGGTLVASVKPVTNQMLLAGDPYSIPTQWYLKYLRTMRKLNFNIKFLFAATSSVFKTRVPSLDGFTADKFTYPTIGNASPLFGSVIKMASGLGTPLITRYCETTNYYGVDPWAPPFSPARSLTYSGEVKDLWFTAAVEDQRISWDLPSVSMVLNKNLSTEEQVINNGVVSLSLAHMHFGGALENRLAYMTATRGIKCWRSDMPEPPDETGFGNYVNGKMEYNDKYHKRVILPDNTIGYEYNPTALDT